ncbi:MAG: protein kinase [Deltaproteobacteria bacterium]|nr:protein kinase [Deltaproteobacteria bacterium]
MLTACELRRFAARLLIACALLCAASAALAQQVPTPDELARLEAALAANPQDDAARVAYGEALLAAGDALGSLRVLNPDRVPGPDWVRELRASARLYRKRGQLFAARKALRDAVDLMPNDRALYAELSEAIAAERATGKPTPPSPTPEPAQAASESAASASEALPAPLSPTDETREAERTRAARAAAPPAPKAAPQPPALTLNHALAGAALIVLAAGALLLRRVLRGNGDLAVAIELPEGARATLSVRLARERERQRPPPRADAQLAARASSRFEHNMVARETHFRGIPAGSYWVTVEGVVESGASKEGVRDDLEVVVEKGRAARAEFDLRPEASPVDVRVVRGGTLVANARIALSGDPTSLKRAREGALRLSLPIGAHTILIGAEDRAAERNLKIERIAPLAIEVDLDDAAGLTFHGCEAAVEPFLRGDLSVAAAALEKVGQRERAAVLAGRFYQSRRSVGKSAERFEAAGRWLEAAELRAEAGELTKAAALFERAGDLARAAEMYNASGDLARAGGAYEQAGDYEAASVCYREAGDEAKLLDALEKKGDFFEAGEIAQKRGEATRAIRNLQQIDSRNANYLTACRKLAAIYSEQGKHELAMQKAEEAVTFSRPEEADAETYVWYGNLLARAGRIERAIEVLMELQQRAPEHPGLTTRIEELRKELSSARREGSAATQTYRSAFGETSRYELREEIGAGGMGIVLRAHDRRLGRDVALKRLPDNLKDHPKAVDLFLREARAAAALNHPNIVTLHDVDEEAGIYFITMELMVGRTLAQVVKQHGRLAARDAARIAMQVAAGLGYAHNQRIVHRDIKTSNLFLTEDRIVKIMDFGLAKMLEEVRRSTTVIGGTPYYMAPEQAAGDQVDGRADIYAFGVTLFELVTGRRPFETGDVTYHHRHTPAPDPRSLGVEVPEAMANLILQMMAKSPSDRPGTAEQVAQRLRAIAGAAKK